MEQNQLRSYAGVGFATPFLRLLFAVYVLFVARHQIVAVPKRYVTQLNYLVASTTRRQLKDIVAVTK